MEIMALQILVDWGMVQGYTFALIIYIIAHHIHKINIQKFFEKWSSHTEGKNTFFRLFLFSFFSPRSLSFPSFPIFRFSYNPTYLLHTADTGI
jgi:hypothetical protein